MTIAPQSITDAIARLRSAALHMPDQLIAADIMTICNRLENVQRQYEEAEFEASVYGARYNAALVAGLPREGTVT